MARKTGVTIRVLSNRLPSIPKALEAAAAREVATAGYDVEARAKQLVPVRTGTLRRSIHTVISNNGMTATIGPSVDYGLFVEMGTHRMPARPYMRPAAAYVSPRFADAIKRVLQGL